MKIDIDIIHRGKVIGLFFLQFYKITTGTLLTIFIPQSCGDELCSLKQNYEKAYDEIKIVVGDCNPFINNEDIIAKEA